MSETAQSGDQTPKMFFETSPNNFFARLADGRILGLSHLIFMEPKSDTVLLHLTGSTVNVDFDTANALSFALFDAPKHYATHQPSPPPPPPVEPPPPPPGSELSGVDPDTAPLTSPPQ